MRFCAHSSQLKMCRSVPQTRGGFDGDEDVGGADGGDGDFAEFHAGGGVEL